MATCGWRREAPRAAGVARGDWRGRGAKPLAGARARRAAPGVGATAVGGLVGARPSLNRADGVQYADARMRFAGVAQR